MGGFGFGLAGGRGSALSPSAVAFLLPSRGRKDEGVAALVAVLLQSAAVAARVSGP